MGAENLKIIDRQITQWLRKLEGRRAKAPRMKPE